MTIDTKNLRVLAEAGKATGFDLVDMNEHDFAACQKAKRELRTAMTPTAVVELLDALERKDRVLREALEAIEIAKNGLDWFKDSYPHDVNESDAEASEQINEAIEAITKEIGT